MWAIILIIALALSAFQARPDLCTNANTVANLDVLYLGPDLDGLTYDFMTYTDGSHGFTPAAGYSVDIRSANATALDLDVDVMISKLFWLELHKRFWISMVMSQTVRCHELWQ